ncbi:MAG: hypothetical protein M3Z21_16420, partial [Pseudomonadota bacterium]|nr:hypothetical protein [Pseudomonadota bacterium]
MRKSITARSGGNALLRLYRLLPAAGLLGLQAAPAPAQEADPGVIDLSPITVVGELDTGYAAQQAISATRTAAPREEIPQTVEVLN